MDFNEIRPGTSILMCQALFYCAAKKICGVERKYVMMKEKQKGY